MTEAAHPTRYTVLHATDSDQRYRALRSLSGCLHHTLIVTAHSLDHTEPNAVLVEELRQQIADLTKAVAEMPKRLLAEVTALKPLMSVKDVAKTLGVSERKVETLIADEELRPLWIGGQRRFHPDTLAAYVASATTKRAA